MKETWFVSFNLGQARLPLARTLLAKAGLVELASLAPEGHPQQSFRRSSRDMETRQVCAGFAWLEVVSEWPPMLRIVYWPSKTFALPPVGGSAGVIVSQRVRQLFTRVGVRQVKHAPVYFGA